MAFVAFDVEIAKPVPDGPDCAGAWAAPDNGGDVNLHAAGERKRL